MLLKLYSKLVSDFHKFTLLLISIIIILSFYYSKNFNLDASSDALLLEGDKDLKYLREINNRYESKDFLFLTYSPVTSFKRSLLPKRSLNIFLSNRIFSMFKAKLM